MMEIEEWCEQRESVLMEISGHQSILKANNERTAHLLLLG